ncbi:hypothetical protein HPB51_007429 [Rhipicephalus microplus]|uniref:Uncharacterized protein n=1 Tax=Rhipicephalus microplus TaxID=6941 RepID=A0A9J6EZ76_RHIMP|nr:hypothetical protein HPB51_007429 [Rhipicephalus microplus]
MVWLVFESSGQSVSGSVVHVDGHVVLRVSSSEWGIRKQLVSATDRSAAAAVASVLARRCLEAGLLCVEAPTGDGDQQGSLRRHLLEQSRLLGFEPYANAPMRVQDRPSSEQDGGSDGEKACALESFVSGPRGRIAS